MYNHWHTTPNSGHKECPCEQCHIADILKVNSEAKLHCKILPTPNASIQFRNKTASKLHIPLTTSQHNHRMTLFTGISKFWGSDNPPKFKK